MAIQAPKGTKDVTPKESYKWQYIEAQARAICEAYGFREIRTPVIEHTELFLRGVGDTTDIVQKEWLQDRIFILLCMIRRKILRMR